MCSVCHNSKMMCWDNFKTSNKIVQQNRIHNFVSKTVFESFLVMPALLPQSTPCLVSSLVMYASCVKSSSTKTWITTRAIFLPVTFWISRRKSRALGGFLQDIKRVPGEARHRTPRASAFLFNEIYCKDSIWTPGRNSFSRRRRSMTREWQESIFLRRRHRRRHVLSNPFFT